MRRDVKDFAAGLALGAVAVIAAARFLRWLRGEREIRWPWR
jgi:hypothetical protein